MKKNKMKKIAGFTMIEMMIGVVVIGILAAMAGPGFSNWIPRMKLKAEAREKVNYLRQARSRAIAENSQYGVYFNTSNGETAFFKDTNSPQLATYESGADSLVEDLIETECNVFYANCTLSNDAVVFFPNGSASTSGTIELHDTESDYEYAITVLASTGRIRLD
ncbi:MAG: prepilin-type N-terminal cleavage/methylation domain-containing protein [candidate division Zixibacteria bacterium]|nr:prepilin-type N-terminal cleavage/methylation domain-containing protein [candidate division Zixibacteria bacterium]